MSPKSEQARWTRIKRVYGLTKENYDQLVLAHCPICLRPWRDNVRPVVDHDHVSGYVRGILCSYCNHYVVGRLRDVSVVERLAGYLKNQPMTHKVPVKKRRKKRGR